jgi:hypothetical protein
MNKDTDPAGTSTVIRPETGAKFHATTRSHAFPAWGFYDARAASL